MQKSKDPQNEYVTMTSIRFHHPKLKPKSKFHRFLQGHDQVI